MENRYTKIRFKSGEFYLEYESTKNGTVHSFKSWEPPQDSFRSALQALLPYLIKICRLDREAWEDGQVTGLTIKYEGPALRRGFTATAITFDDGLAIVCNSPYKRPSLIPDDIHKTLEVICEEAERYLNGDRRQLQLTLDPVTMLEKQWREDQT